MEHSNYNPIDDPDQFPEHFPKPMPIYLDLRYSGRLLIDGEDLAHIRKYQSPIYPPTYNLYNYNGLNIVETITIDDTVAPSTWAWFKGLWR